MHIPHKVFENKLKTQANRALLVAFSTKLSNALCENLQIINIIEMPYSLIGII